MGESPAEVTAPLDLQPRYMTKQPVCESSTTTLPLSSKASPRHPPWSYLNRTIPHSPPTSPTRQTLDRATHLRLHSSNALLPTRPTLLNPFASPTNLPIGSQSMRIPTEQLSFPTAMTRKRRQTKVTSTTSRYMHTMRKYSKSKTNS